MPDHVVGMLYLLKLFFPEIKFSKTETEKLIHLIVEGIGWI